MRGYLFHVYSVFSIYILDHPWCPFASQHCGLTTPLYICNLIYKHKSNYIFHPVAFLSSLLWFPDIVWTRNYNKYIFFIQNKKMHRTEMRRIQTFTTFWNSVTLPFILVFNNISPLSICFNICEWIMTKNVFTGL